MIVALCQRIFRVMAKLWFSFPSYFISTLKTLAVNARSAFSDGNLVEVVVFILTMKEDVSKHVDNI